MSLEFQDSGEVVGEPGEGVWKGGCLDVGPVPVLYLCSEYTGMFIHLDTHSWPAPFSVCTWYFKHTHKNKAKEITRKEKVLSVCKALHQIVES